ncbi:yjeF C-terminal region, hydroxyethylthiazole kinase-related/yjeF N-terminal region [Gillisia sp. Hel1_33_143]|uniref:NAD(P)H-hydrate dehydratase n=1 Tax=Gillisia sp. Hel1_33_143 TaxID=1336796 RepID=UPI00087C50A4|nr:NAD(P)H-hydrate dehydratase [Gillisia sp. Hel1_33_143]SDS52312.1 yjeF C-terminal region, hydroxyethylthiazole kinase-related/yjeF N-terminal region [Gillisia sp. Hel1_33_143]
MKIFDVKQLAEADKVTMEKQNISSLELMERAAGLVFEDIHSKLQSAQIPIKVFCGIGNNGGDGLVIGRLLLEHGYQVTMYVVNYSNNRSDNFLQNYDRVKDITNDWPKLLKSEKDFPEIGKNDFVIDAIFGIGLNRALENWVGKLVEHINASNAFVLSVDMPSGLFSDKIPTQEDRVIKANVTISFQAPKFVFFLPQTSDYVGDLQVIDIGLDREYLIKTHSNIQLINKEEAKAMFQPRKNNTHKGNYGHTLIIGGSYGKIGSIVLAATAALRTGAGLVSVYVPKCGYDILQISVPEAMVLTDENDQELITIDFELDPDVICFGMGAGTSSKTALALEGLLKKTKNAMVIDADGLNILSNHKDYLSLLPENSVLTPHPKELERLIGSWQDDFDKLEKAKKFTKEYKVILVIKGAHTMVISGENIYINNTGNPGMATAGSGDVLSGVIAGLISQKYDTLTAAVFGVYLHGRTGDILADKKSYQGLISGDIANNMGEGYLDLFKN